METMEYSNLRTQLLERREKLEKSIPEIQNPSSLILLLKEVDLALERMNQGIYGRCEVCHENIEPNRLLHDPLIKVCLDHLDDKQQKLLEYDLELAAKVQRALLPKNDQIINNWEISYFYQPTGAVSGDYCDLVIQEEGGEYIFLVGDVSGKGIPAAMLMSNLHALFRSLISFNFSVKTLLEEANRLFCQSTISSYYATLVCGKASQAGEIELCNAGHCMPLLLQNGKAAKFKPTGLPIGLFCNSQYNLEKMSLNSGDVLLIYTDGLSEAFHNEDQYGEERVIELAEKNFILSPKEQIKEYIKDLSVFKKDVPQNDDITIMILKRL
jgi:sigma-B regulation protein RsbU (phosphoserine phosphatase)